MVATTLEANIIFDSVDSHTQLKKIIQKNYHQLREKFNPQQSVENLLRENAHFIDNVLTLCWHHFLQQYSKQICLIATGGYGREELFPHSDVDILILLKSSDISNFQDNLSCFSNFLWDIGLKPGQSVRTVNECLESASNDQTIMTSLIEMRLISGDSVLFDTLNQQLNRQKTWSSEQFFTAKMDEQTQRYAKYHDTAYNLEPNIKEGPGGLRDLQNIAWVFKYHYRSPTLKQLIQYNFFSEAEYNELIGCRNILWRIRFALHYIANRCEDRLVFDNQRELANQFGFLDDHNEPDVEQFMQYYFKTVMQLERMNEMLLQLFNEKIIDPESTVKELNPSHPNYVTVNGYLKSRQETLFIQQPLSLLEIFTVLQQHKSLKGITASTIRLIRGNLHRIDDDFRHNPQANKLFLSILSAPRGITHQLRRMNRYGILAAYLPCFANIVARMQYDLFHIYTVDAHTLFVLRNLRRFSLEKHDNELPFCNNVFLRISKPTNLYITALFHDIAKGMGGDHSSLGAEIVKQFCIQHQLSKHSTKLICWLVKNHLTMSMTAQRKDINDPNVIHKFALQVGNIEYLNHLYLLTVADIRATSPSLWNSWKDSLLLDLYTFTYSALHRGLQNPVARTELLYENKQEAKDELIGLGISESTIQKVWQQISDDYFLRYSADEIAWHTIAIAATDKQALPLVIIRPQNQRGSAEVFVYTQNKKNIFSISAETLDYLGLSILDARISTSILSVDEQYVLNSFQVLEQSGELIKDLDRELHICHTLRDNLVQRKVPERVNIHRQSRQARHFPIPSRVNFHKDPLGRYTVIELVTTDFTGLLAAMGRTFIALKIQLHDAKITTIGSRVEDMFYVTDEQSEPIIDPDRLETIKQKIILILENQTE